MGGVKDFLITNCKFIFNGALVWVTVLILATFTLSFMHGLLKRNGEVLIFKDLEKAYQLHFILVCYMTSLFLAISALFMTFYVGPGYSSEHFKSVKLEPLQLVNGMDTVISQSSFRDSEDCRGKEQLLYDDAPHEAGGARSISNYDTPRGSVTTNNVAIKYTFAEQDRDQTYSIYLKSEY